MAKIGWPHIALLLIIILALSLRLYNLEGYLQFLGDQGRDALIVKRMIIDHKWTLLGPAASVGGFFTGPIYYYFMLPFLWASGLNPVGPAYLAGLFGLGVIVLTFFFCRTFFNTRVAILASFLVAINPKMVEISRFSWNPNPIPFFCLLTIFLLYQAAFKNQKVYSFAAGISLGILYQLHYMTMAFIGLSVLAAFFIVPPKQFIKHALFAAGGFLVGVSPFLAFELRHGFPNTQSVIEFITRESRAVSPREANFFALILEILRRLYEYIFVISGRPLLVLLYSSLIGSLFFFIKNWSRPARSSWIKLVLLGSWLILGAFGVGNYRGDLHAHYFSYLFPLPFFLASLTGVFLLRAPLGRAIFILSITLLIYAQISALYFWQSPNRMLDQIKEIDRQVLAFAEDKPYNLALVSSFNSDYSYRYFLEIWNKAPVVIENETNDPGRATVTDTLVVICDVVDCKLLGNSLWEIAGFGGAEVATSWEGPAGITVHKLVHYTRE